MGEWIAVFVTLIFAALIIYFAVYLPGDGRVIWVLIAGIIWIPLAAEVERL